MLDYFYKKMIQLGRLKGQAKREHIPEKKEA